MIRTLHGSTYKINSIISISNIIKILASVRDINKLVTFYFHNNTITLKRVDIEFVYKM